MMRRMLLMSVALSAVAFPPAAASTAERYYPSWTNELNWTNNPVYTRPYGSAAWVEENYKPWWQSRVAHPIDDYSGDLLDTGKIRLDLALEAGMTWHRPKKSWTTETSPSAINQVWTFTPGSRTQEDATMRGYQNTYLNFGMHPLKHLSADIGAEIVAAYDQRYWFPVNDEHRMYKDDVLAKITRGEVKFDNEMVLLRGFTGVPVYGWQGENDLFQLLPPQYDVEFYRRWSGTVLPTGGEMRVRSPYGTLSALGGSEIRWGYGPSAFAKYDFPAWGSWENSLVYRNEQIPWGYRDDERRWATSLNSSYGFSERLTLHGGLLYQPFRKGWETQDVETEGDTITFGTKKTSSGDAFGGTLRGEWTPEQWLDRVGLGYTYLGATAGNKQQIDVDGGKAVQTNWTLSAAYSYRRPIYDAVPLYYEGTEDNKGALVSNPRGPDDPFHVWWDNRESHLGSLTLVFDPTPATPLFRYQRNVLEEYNINPDEDARWIGALQYRLTHYPTMTDRLFYYEEDRTLKWDDPYADGARAASHPFSSAIGLVRWIKDRWRVTTELAGGEALAGNARAYVAAENYYKPSTVFFSGALTVEFKPVKAFFRYAQDVWGPGDYHTSFGWAYHHLYQAGLSAQFARDFEAGVRYVGARQNETFIGSDTGAFNEVRGYLTYHFAFEKDISRRVAAMGRPLPRAIPEARLSASRTRLTPGAGSIDLVPQSLGDTGLLSWRLVIRNDQGGLVKKWEGRGAPPESLRWDGFSADGSPLAAGSYRAVLDLTDLYGNEITSPPQALTLEAKAVETPKPYAMAQTDEGLKLTLSSLVLFDVNKYDLMPLARQALDQVAELLKAYPNSRIRVSGHTDSLGSDAYNQKLSERRARSVTTYLLETLGVNHARFEGVGYGESRPVADNRTEEGRQQNRRVEIDILK